MANEIIYIASDNRSGSTLLDQLLGAHEEIFSLGEVHHLAAYALEDRRRYDPTHPLICSCGDPVSTCGFWQDVQSELGDSLESLLLNPTATSATESESFAVRQYRRFLRSLVWRYPQLYRHPLTVGLTGGLRAGRDSFRLFDAIFKVRSVKYLVDSSKSAFRLRSLYQHHPHRLRIVVLSRDYRAVTYSKLKRGQSIHAAAQGWANRMRHIRQLVKDVPDSHCIRIKYEDLCRDAEPELIRVCKYLDIPFSDQLLTRCATDIHHLGGSPSKFEAEKAHIRLDESYLGKFSAKQLNIIERIASGEAKYWGYS